MSDPVRQFEHSHSSLTKLALEVRELVLAEPPDGRAATRIRKRLLARLEALSEELLQHFANEEEGLFPFVRQNVPSKTGVVDRLQASHDVICGSLVRLGHVVERDRRALGAGRATVTALYERFEVAYTQHSQEEAALFGGLGGILDERQRAELAEILRGL
jgi:iron-sulfur cluster repair protein YtfE (RIC family)